MYIKHLNRNKNKVEYETMKEYYLKGLISVEVL